MTIEIGVNTLRVIEDAMGFVLSLYLLNIFHTVIKGGKQ